jgi:hypothetical protein
LSGILSVLGRRQFHMQNTVRRPKIMVSGDASGIVSHAVIAADRDGTGHRAGVGVVSLAARKTPGCATCRCRLRPEPDLSQIVALTCELLAWTAMLTLTGPARRWEPRRLRLRLFSAAARIVRGGRRLLLRLAARWPWTGQITSAIGRLQALAPGRRNGPVEPRLPGATAGPPSTTPR